MTLVSWAKKELAKLKVQSSKRLLLPPPPQTTTLKTSVNKVSELAADLRCTKCREKVAALASTLNGDVLLYEIIDLESIVVDVVEKKVTLTRNPINH
ncbi:hypothetical protein SASPL_154909 [Salvia splendens]|uniref:Uncharacterized protein n=1 Tax=Salvia splendens TaxID=180675 RepID=A0A8X8YZP7_SALSN|nr:hypothetical protein SASPL_154909 [Salvia splendens]